MSRGIGDPRWCPHCQLVVKGKYLADGDGEHLICHRCTGEVDSEETPALTTDRAQRRVGFGRPGLSNSEILYEDEKRTHRTDESLEILEAVAAVRSTRRIADERYAEFADLGRQYNEASGRLNAANAHAETAGYALRILVEGEPT